MSEKNYGQTMHWQIITLIQKLGYNMVGQGVCFGIARMAAQSSLLGAEGLKRFDERLQRISLLTKLADKTNFSSSALEAYLKNINNDVYWDAIAFLEGVLLYQGLEQEQADKIITRPVTLKTTEKLEGEGDRSASI